MKNDKTGRIMIGVFIQMAVLALLTVTAVAQTSTTTRTLGTATTTTRQETGTVVFVEGNTVAVQMSNGDLRTVTVPDSRTAMIDGKRTNVHGLKVGTTITATYTTTTTPVTDRTVSNLTGTVWFVSGTTVILTLPDGTNKVYKSLPGYKFTVNGRPDADVSSLRKGMRIAAEKIEEEPGTIITNNTIITGSAPKPAVVLAQSKAPTAARAPTAAPAQLEATPAPAPAPAQAAAPAPESEAAATPPARLPKTGSILPLAGMLGLLFMGAGFGLRVVRRP
jgi:hypothetical protein